MTSADQHIVPYILPQYSDSEWSNLYAGDFSQFLDNGEKSGKLLQTSNNSNEWLNLNHSSDLGNENYAVGCVTDQHAVSNQTSQQTQGVAPQMARPSWMGTPNLEYGQTHMHANILASPQSNPDFLSLGGSPTPPLSSQKKYSRLPPNTPRQQPRYLCGDESPLQQRALSRSVSRGRTLSTSPVLSRGSSRDYRSMQAAFPAVTDELLSPGQITDLLNDLDSRQSQQSHHVQAQAYTNPDASIELFSPTTDPAGMTSHLALPSLSIQNEYCQPSTHTQYLVGNTSLGTSAMPPTSDSTFKSKQPKLTHNLTLRSRHTPNTAVGMTPSQSDVLAVCAQAQPIGLDDSHLNMYNGINNVSSLDDPFVNDSHYTSIPSLGELADPEMDQNFNSIGSGTSFDFDLDLLPSIFMDPEPLLSIESHSLSQLSPPELYTPSTPLRRSPCPSYESPDGRRGYASEPRQRRTPPTNKRLTPRQHRRYRSASSETTPLRRTQKPSATSSVDAPLVDFVNFTPEDSGQILNGVAASGSMKTKARRDKEAAEDRRRINQAAVQAVLDAGGDLQALTRAGILL